MVASPSDIRFALGNLRSIRVKTGGEIDRGRRKCLEIIRIFRLLFILHIQPTSDFHKSDKESVFLSYTHFFLCSLWIFMVGLSIYRRRYCGVERRCRSLCRLGILTSWRLIIGKRPCLKSGRSLLCCSHAHFVPVYCSQHAIDRLVRRVAFSFLALNARWMAPFSRWRLGTSATFPIPNWSGFIFQERQLRMKVGNWFLPCMRRARKKMKSIEHFRNEMQMENTAIFGFWTDEVFLFRLHILICTNEAVMIFGDYLSLSLIVHWRTHCSYLSRP